MAIRPLSELKPGEKGTILKVEGSGAIHRRILEMGMVAGSEVEVEHVAPLGDPIAVKVKGYQLALRKEEAARIQVEVAAMPLALAPPGNPVKVVAIQAGWGLRRRLAAMGITPGVQVRVVSRGEAGPLTVQSPMGEVVLGRGMAHKVMVQEEGWRESSSSPS